MNWLVGAAGGQDRANQTNHPSRLAEVGSRLRMTLVFVVRAYFNVVVSASENASSVRSSRSGVTDT